MLFPLVRPAIKRAAPSGSEDDVSELSLRMRGTAPAARIWSRQSEFSRAICESAKTAGTCSLTLLEPSSRTNGGTAPCSAII